MALATDNTFHDLNLSDYSTSTSTTSSDIDPLALNWNYWSPIIDLPESFPISGNQDNDFHNIIDSIMGEEEQDEDEYHDPYPLSYSPQTESTPSKMAVNNHDDNNDEEEEEEEDFKGLRLYHLLIAASDALYGENKSHDLAQVILIRLKQLVSPTIGTNLERLTAYYTESLQALLECTPGKPHHHHHLHRVDHSPNDVLSAFQLLQEITPYVKFGHFTANQAILEGVANDRRVHIIDYDIMEGIQWASLMQGFVSRKEGFSAPHLRITAISRGGNCNGRRFIGNVQETGRRLVAFAASIGQPFSFHQCKLDSDETFKPSNLKLVKGETLVINCMLNLPHFNYRTSESVNSFLAGVKNLNPRLITLVEEEIGFGTIKEGDYKVQFLDSLERYSAIYDSLEAEFPMKNRSRTLVERVFLGPRIYETLVRIRDSCTDEENCSWGERMEKMGFKEMEISFANHCQARLLLGLFNDGYKVEELKNNKMVLGWKSKRLLSASIWMTSSSSHSDSE